MGAAGSVPLSAEAALAAGHSQEEVDAYVSKAAAQAEATKAAAEAAAAEEVPKETPSETTDSAAETTTPDAAAATTSTSQPTETAKAPEADVADTTADKDQKVGFVLEFSATDMSSRPKTSKRAPARFRNRPPTSRRVKKPTEKKTAVKDSTGELAAVADKAPETAGATAKPNPTAKNTAAAPAAATEPAEAAVPGPETTSPEQNATQAPAKPAAAPVSEEAQKAIEELFEKTRRDSKTEPDGDVTRKQLLETLATCDEDQELSNKLGLPAAKNGKTAVSAFRNAYDEFVTAFTPAPKHEGTSSVDEVATFLSKHRTSIMRMLSIA
jgi:hypothetical protein